MSENPTLWNVEISIQATPANTPASGGHFTSYEPTMIDRYERVDVTLESLERVRETINFATRHLVTVAQTKQEDSL